VASGRPAAAAPAAEEARCAPTAALFRLVASMMREDLVGLVTTLLADWTTVKS